MDDSAIREGVEWDPTKAIRELSDRFGSGLAVIILPLPIACSQLESQVGVGNGCHISWATQTRQHDSPSWNCFPQNQEQRFLRHHRHGEWEVIHKDSTTKNAMVGLRWVSENNGETLTTWKKALLCVWWNCRVLVCFEGWVQKNGYGRPLQRLAELCGPRRQQRVNTAGVKFFHDSIQPHSAKITQHKNRWFGVEASILSAI